LRGDSVAIVVARLGSSLTGQVGNGRVVDDDHDRLPAPTGRFRQSPPGRRIHRAEVQNHDILVVGLTAQQLGQLRRRRGRPARQDPQRLPSRAHRRADRWHERLAGRPEAAQVRLRAAVLGK